MDLMWLRGWSFWLGTPERSYESGGQFERGDEGDEGKRGNIKNKIPMPFSPPPPTHTQRVQRSGEGLSWRESGRFGRGRIPRQLRHPRLPVQIDARGIGQVTKGDRQRDICLNH